MVGSCRGPDDEARLLQLQQYAEQLGLSEAVEWHVNVPYSKLKQLLGGAVGGLHTMLDEHFGISVVEYMAAGMRIRVELAHSVCYHNQGIPSVMLDIGDVVGRLHSMLDEHFGVSYVEYMAAGVWIVVKCFLQTWTYHSG
jgi:alpha-1,2-mannosyltransferase